MEKKKTVLTALFGASDLRATLLHVSGTARARAEGIPGALVIRIRRSNILSHLMRDASCLRDSARGT